jgi:hypothetical protein
MAKQGVGKMATALILNAKIFASMTQPYVPRAAALQESGLARFFEQHNYIDVRKKVRNYVKPRLR